MTKPPVPITDRLIAMVQKLVHFSGVMVLNPFIIKSFTSLVLNGQLFINYSKHLESLA
jgi:hypothetical protein